MKSFKLNVHQKTFSEEEVVINPKDYDGLKIGDIIEIYSPEDGFSRLLLQVKSFPGESQQKNKTNGTISIEETIATSFQLRSYGDVIVNLVDPNKVALDSVEVMFKDQYMARSDMSRLKKHLSKSCVYLNKKIEFIGVRCQVFEMWSQGERMACGFVSEDTKVVYRSASSMVYLFLQMSSEMWDYDINGDLYFEKAVNGFLSDLFDKWKKFKCTHDVTIVLFSRTFYAAQSIGEFPEDMKECLQQDYKNRFYEDFYRVAIQNERYEDWSSILILLKKLFNQYENEVLKYHEKKGSNVPKAFNSTSSQGNFLEVLNMSLNVFEKHYLDRSFDRTGQLSVVISPGVGVFEVDFDLTNITKQRIIDNGIGSDLVCLGEQPLHAVPLFKFNRKQSSSYPLNAADVYNMPHWINLSFYSSSKQISYASFVPRIKMPNILHKQPDKPSRTKALYRSPSRDSTTSSSGNSANMSCRSMISLVDYDEYDAQIFRPPAQASSSNNTCQPSRRRKSAMTPIFQERLRFRRVSDSVPPDFELTSLSSSQGGASSAAASLLSTEAMPIPSAHNSNRLSASSSHGQLSTSVENKCMKEIRPKMESKDDLTVHGYNVQNAGRSPNARPKALINPFDPSHVTIKLTSNRRRWTHVFPLGPTGIFMQQHHYQAVPQNTACTLLPSEACQDSDLVRSSADDHEEGYRKVIAFSQRTSESPWTGGERRLSPRSHSNTPFPETGRRSASDRVRTTSAILSADPHTDKSLTWAWGATGEQEWTPAITTGVDWKSLVVPACLPITTDFYPDKRSLQNDYVMSAYTLLPEDQGIDLLQRRRYRGAEDSRTEIPFSTQQVYQELICQRLQQGFQLILLQRPPPANPLSCLVNGPVEQDVVHDQDCTMSIGRIFHRLSLSDTRSVTVTQYRPRHPYPVIKLHYCYRFRAPDNETYAVSWVDFSSERLETYNWNYLDNYVCLRGEEEYELRENLKFWRMRLLLLPNCHTIVKQIYDNACEESELLCDLFSPLNAERRCALLEGFIKFMEIINKIRRPQPTRRPKKVHPTGRRNSSAITVSNSHREELSAFRDRGASVSISLLEKVRRVAKNEKLSERARDEMDGNSHSSPTSGASDQDAPSHGQTKAGLETTPDGKRLTANSSPKEIVESLKTSGLSFVKQAGLPQNTFVSSEAVSWAVDSIHGISNEPQAISMFENILSHGLICHCSGERSHPFKFGFYLYYIVDKTTSIHQDNIDLEMFQTEWLEVETAFQPDTELDCEAEEAGLVLNNGSQRKNFKFNKTTIDVDNGRKSGRVEWVHVRYHEFYEPEQAFEVVLEWMVATANQIAEIVQQWTRKAGNHGLHLVPIPSEPFALPFAYGSDPLRGPIFLTINLECLPPSSLLDDDDQLVRFRETILTSFGFIPFFEPSNESQRQYVHVSGCMFVMIPNSSKEQNQTKTVAGRNPLNLQSQQCVETEPICSPHEEYITRHFTGVKQTEETKDMKKAGFLWSWNYMLTKRWKTSTTGDEVFWRKVMHDFRRFCSNDQNRLFNFWQEYSSDCAFGEKLEAEATS